MTPKAVRFTALMSLNVNWLLLIVGWPALQGKHEVALKAILSTFSRPLGELPKRFCVLELMSTNRLIRRITPSLLAALLTMAVGILPLLAPALYAQSSPPPLPRLVLAAQGGDYQRQQAFGPDGQLVLNINVADVAIRKGDTNTLKLIIQSQDASQQDRASWVREFIVSRQYAKVHLELPKHTNGSHHIVIYVPEQTSVRLSIEVGNASLDALNGNVEADIGIGNLGVGTLDSAKYHQASASVTMGNITDHAFNMSVSGMFGKEGSYHGEGTLKMKLHARIGNIDIDKGNPPGEQALRLVAAAGLNFS